MSDVGIAQPLTRARVPTRLLERAPELERVERIPARRVVQPDQHRPGKRDAEALPQQTMNCADTQRPDPQSPQLFTRKRTVEPQRSRLPAAAAACDEHRVPAPAASRRSANASTDADGASSHCTSSTATSNGPPASSPSSRNRANAIARSSGGAPATSSSSRAADKRPTLWQAAIGRAPPAAPAARDQRAPRTRMPSRSQPDGRRRRRSPARGPTRPSRRTAWSSRSLPHRPSTIATGTRRPAARKSASAATSASRPTIRPRSRPARSSTTSRSGERKIPPDQRCRRECASRSPAPTKIAKPFVSIVASAASGFIGRLGGGRPPRSPRPRWNRGGREPSLAPGPRCAWCPRRDTFSRRQRDGLSVKSGRSADGSGREARDERPRAVRTRRDIHPEMPRRRPRSPRRATTRPPIR